MENEASPAPVPAHDAISHPAAEESAAPLAAGLEIGSQAETAPAREPLVLRGRMMPDGTAVATGRRKTAVARVRLKRGAGDFVVNGRPLAEFFCIERDRLTVEAPLRITGVKGQVDIWVRTSGGGTSGQSGAIVLGIARALQVYNPDFHELLSSHGLLTRDGRMVERKKYGHKKARRSFQFSKR